MNQIETLKWIAANGNPIGTEVEADYLRYKEDPTFRSIAKDLAYNGNPIGRGDAEKAYNSYKDTVHLETEAPLPEATDPDTVQGGVVFMHPTTPEKAEAYANNEIGVSDIPRLTKDALVDYFSKFKSGPFNEESAPARSWAVEHPGTVATVAASPFLPVGGVGAALVSGGASVAGNAIDQGVAKYRHGTPFDVDQLLAAGAAGTMFPMIANAGVGLANKVFGPVANRLAAYPGKLAKWEDDNALAQMLHEGDQNAIRDISREAARKSSELNAPMTEEDILAELPGASPEQRRRALDNSYAEDAINARLRLDAIKERMKNAHPDFDYQGKLQQVFDNQLEPNDFQAAKYWEDITKPYTPIERPVEPRGMSFFGRSGDAEENVLAGRNIAEKLLPPIITDPFLNNRWAPKLAIRGANAIQDASRVAVPFASGAPYQTLGATLGTGLEAGSYLMNRVLGKKSE